MKGAVLDVGRRLHPAALAVAAAALGFMTINALPPPTDWDTLMYHLAVPRDALRSGSLLAASANPERAFVGSLHALYLPFLAAGSAAGPAILSVGFTAVLALAAAALALRFLDRGTASFAMATLWGSMPIVLVGATPRIDVTLSLYLLLCIHLLLMMREGAADGTGAAALAGAFAGFAVAIKYHALAYLACLAPLAVVALARRRTAGEGAPASARAPVRRFRPRRGRARRRAAGEERDRCSARRSTRSSRDPRRTPG